ncbi:MAG: helix-turn-helix domain-containing protein [bacterium]|nr:helix-turn-helix domain-containing protein [bacterium]
MSRNISPTFNPRAAERKLSEDLEQQPLTEGSAAAETESGSQPEPTRAYLLAEIASLPPNALLNSSQAAAVLGTSIGVLANWRSRRTGPPYCGARAFIRYRLSDLNLWMSQRAGEVRLTDEMEGV